MDTVLQFLSDYGLWGMFLSSLLAGTVLPFSSEVVMLALAAAGVSPVALLVTATLGNTLGGVINYWIGTLGKEEWLMRYLRTSPERLQRGIGYAHRYGYWSGLLAWVPILGSVLAETFVLVVAFQIIREVETGDVPFQTAAVGQVEEVGIILFVQPRVGFRQFALADAGDAVQEHLAIGDQRIVQPLQLPVASAEEFAGLRKPWGRIR